MLPPTGTISILFFAGSLAISTLRNVDEQCHPCSEVKCPTLPNICASQATLDKCGCCLECDEVSRPLLRLAFPFRDAVESTFGVRLNNPFMNSVIESGHKSLLQFFFKPLSQETSTPILKENINIHLIPLDLNSRKSKPTHLRANFSTTQNTSLLQKILGIFGRHNSITTTTPLPTCKLVDELTVKPETDRKVTTVTTDFKKDDSKSLSNQTDELEKYEEVHGRSYLSDAIDSAEDPVSITHLKFIPLRITFSNLRGFREDMTNSGNYEFHEFLKSPQIQYMNLHPHRNDDEENMDLMTQRKGEIGGSTENELQLIATTEVYNLMKGEILDQQKLTNQHFEDIDNIDVERHKNGEQPAVGRDSMDKESVYLNSVADNSKEPSLNAKLNLISTKSIDTSGKEVTVTKKPRLEVHVDSPDFGSRQLEENMVEIEDKTSIKKTAENIKNVVENTTAGNKLFIAHTGTDQVIPLIERTVPGNFHNKVAEDTETKLPLESIEKSLLNDSDKMTTLNFPQQYVSSENTMSEHYNTVMTTYHIEKEKLDKYLETTSRPEEFKAGLELLGLKQKNKGNKFHETAVTKNLTNDKSKSDFASLSNEYQVKYFYVNLLKKLMEAINTTANKLPNVNLVTEQAKHNGNEETGDKSIGVGTYRDKLEEMKNLALETSMKTEKLAKKFKKNPVKTMYKIEGALREFFDALHQGTEVEIPNQELSTSVTYFATEAGPSQSHVGGA